MQVPLVVYVRQTGDRQPTLSYTGKSTVTSVFAAAREQNFTRRVSESERKLSGS
jgi:hypothetical protein